MWISMLLKTGIVTVSLKFNLAVQRMDKILCFQNCFCVFLLIIQSTFLVVGRNVSEIEICQQGNQTIQHQLHIKSPSFPDAWTSHIKCQCDIEGDNIVIATRTLILTGHTSNSVLEISYNENGSQLLWPQDGMHTMFDQQNRKLVVARMASKIKVSIDTSTAGSAQNMFSLFMFDFQASSDMLVSCQNLSSSNKTTDDDSKHSSNKTDATTSKDLLEEIGSVCSPHFVIILGSLCCSLLLIILIISIILCCVVPRRRKDYTIDYRNQQVTDEKKMRKAAKTGRESIIYDEAKINLRPSAAYNNTTYTNNQQDVNYTNTATENRSALQRSYTMPPPACTRQSAQYVNTMSSEQDFH